MQKLLLLLIFVLVGCGSVNSGIDIEKEGDESERQTERQASNTEPQDEIWSAYVNNRLGIAFEFPKTVMGGELRVSDFGPLVVLHWPETNMEPYLRIKDDVNIFEIVRDKTFHFVVQENIDMAQLEEVIDQKFGEDCWLEGLDPIKKNKEIYTLKVGQPAWKGDEPGSCWINYEWRSIYDKSAGKLITWNLGQGPTFFDTNTGQSFDQRISGSVMLIPQ